MITWTPAANEELRRHLDAVRRRLGFGDGSSTAGVGDGAVDANEVVEDLRRHVDEEFANDRVNVVTVDDVRRVLNRIGLPDEAVTGGESGSSPTAPNPVWANVASVAGQARSAMPLATPAPPTPFQPPDLRALAQVVRERMYSIRRDPRTSPFGSVCIFLFGILAPIVAVVFESLTGLCAETFFDPLPTMWHVPLFLSLPAANLALIAAGAERVARRRGMFNLINAFAIGVGWFYVIIFAPLMPISAIAIIGFGIGLLGLSPLTGLCSAYACRRRYVMAPEPHHARLENPPRIQRGLGLAVVAVLLLHLPGTLTHVGMIWASSDDAGTRGRGLSVLRAVGSEDAMRRACYYQSGRFSEPWMDVGSLGWHVPPERAQEIYYRATGTAFNTRPPPSHRSVSLRGREWDWSQGGDQVAGQLSGLSLAASRIDGVVDADGAWAYAEWTMVFHNDAAVQREARAQVLLPAGGVVSRLTLWINGEPCEAAFGGREQVKQAYKSVVVRRRDPVLVTTCGPDRVMMQCFPVPPGGGEMKIRIGVTFPLQLERADRATFGLPAIIERNFAIADTLAHAVWMESTAALSDATGLFKIEHPKAALYALRGQVADAQLATLPAVLTAARDPNVRTTWSDAPAHVKDPAAIGGGPVVQQVGETAVRTPGRIVVVIDTSKSMAPFVGEVASAMSALPTGASLSVVLADDDVTNLTPTPITVNAEGVRQLKPLHNVQCQGGQDGAPALCKAWDLASESPDGTIVWIHGPQPVKLDDVEDLHQRFERRPDGPRLIMVQAAPGSNRVCESLECQGDISRLPRRGALVDDLRGLFSSWSQTQPILTVTRTVAATRPTTPGAKQTAPHLARLWAAEQVRDAARAGKTTAVSKTARDVARLAKEYQLVTPYTGAVVLETAAQYAANGLTPVDPSTVPTVPEPETVMLLCVVAAAITRAMFRDGRRPWRRRRLA